MEYDIEQFKNDAADLIMAFHNENDKSGEETNNDTNTYVLDLLKETFSLKKCAEYALMIGATLIIGNYIKMK